MIYLPRQCKKYWWTNLLFINNLYPTKMADQCIGHLWYLANDFQFFMISPPLIALYCMRRKLGYLAIWAIIAFSMTINFVMTLSYGFGSFGAFNPNPKYDEMSIMYEKPWIRVAPYLVGGILGLAFFEYKNKETYQDRFGGSTYFIRFFEGLKESFARSIAYFITGIALVMFVAGWTVVTFINCFGKEECIPTSIAAIYNAFAKILYPLGLALILSPLFVGQIKPVIAFMSGNIFAVIAKLSFGIYLIHVPLVIWMLNDTMVGKMFNGTYSLVFFGGAFILNILVSIPFSFAFEVPFMHIEKNLLFP